MFDVSELFGCLPEHNDQSLQIQDGVQDGRQNFRKTVKCEFYELRCLKMYKNTIESA